jgi:hypothetical protein
MELKTEWSRPETKVLEVKQAYEAADVDLEFTATTKHSCGDIIGGLDLGDGQRFPGSDRGI